MKLRIGRVEIIDPTPAELDVLIERHANLCTRCRSSLDREEILHGYRLCAGCVGLEVADMNRAMDVEDASLAAKMAGKDGGE